MTRFCAVVLALASACATITTKETVTETALKARESRGVDNDSRTYTATAEVDGERVIVSVDQSETCWHKTTPRTQRTKHVTRELDSKMMSAVWLVAGFCGFTGGYFLADSQGVADRINSDPSAEPTTPEDVHTTGVVMLSLGLGAAAVAVVDHLRAIDSDEDGGMIEGAEQLDDFPCHEGHTSNEPVLLVLADGTELTGNTDSKGRAEFSLTEVSEAAIPAASSRANSNGSGSMKVVVHGTDLALGLGDSELRALYAALSANPATRLAHDILARRQRACQAELDRSRSMGFTDPEALLKRWSTAKIECGDLWTPQLEEELAATHEKIAAARCTAALERAGTALSGDVDRSGLDAADADIKIAETTCKGENAARLRSMNTRLAKATKQVEQEERLARRRAELQGHVAALERALRDGRAEEAWELLYLEPELRPVAAEQLKDVAWDALGAAVDDVLAASPTRSAAETQMCFVRKVFTTIVGPKELRNAVQRYVSAVGTRDPAMASKVVNALKVGHCANKPAAKKVTASTPAAADAAADVVSADPDATAMAPNGASPQNVPPTLLEDARVAGDKLIVPDDITKTEIARSGKDRIVGSFKICLTQTGAIDEVSMLKSTGFPAYDRKIQSTIRDEWRYRAYLVSGAATPVCTAITFIYSQK